MPQLLNPAHGGPTAQQGVRGAACFTSDAGSIAAVVPSNTVDLPGGATFGLWVTGAGNIAVVCESDTNNNGTIVTVGANVRLPFRVKRVLATGTTATGILALYQ